MASSCCLLLLLLVVGAQCVPNQVIPTEGDEYLMTCGGSGDLSYFLLHQMGELLEPGYHDILKIQVFENATVYFKSISVEHEGTHLCIRNHGGNSKGYPTPLRVRPLPPQDLWGDVYEAKFVTGFTAALIIASLFVLGCLVHKYRWRAPREADASPIISSSAYVNPAMVNDDVESTSSTKM